jgi:uncharacterized protein
MSRASSLHRLQTLDLQIDRRQARLKVIGEILSESTSVNRGRHALSEAESTLRAARSASRLAEEELAANRAKLEEAEKRLYGGSVHNPKELQDLQAEVESLTRYRSALEDRLLEAMVALETAETDQRSAEGALSEATGQTAVRDTTLAEEQARIATELDRLTAEREAALANVTQVDLALYTQVRDNRGGLAVALVQDDTCGACGLTVAHSLRQEIRQGDSLVRCIQCGRILYAG